MDIREKIVNELNVLINSQSIDSWTVACFIYSFLKENDFPYSPTGCGVNGWELELNDEYENLD
jgi:hypothetical protein